MIHSYEQIMLEQYIFAKQQEQSRVQEECQNAQETQRNIDVRQISWNDLVNHL